MSDVRSLEEVIGAAELEWLASVKGSQSETRAEWIAAAVREWCLAEPQIERAASVLSSMTNGQTVWPMDRERTRAVLQAVMGDTP